MFKTQVYFIIIKIIFSIFWLQASAREITFCGEKIPVSEDFVANKLMNAIRRQIPNVNLPELRKNANLYFSKVEWYLKKTGLPDDLKYVAIVESGFRNDALSHAGARGFWQIMPPVAKSLGLIINDFRDDRTDIDLSTYAACRLLAENYLSIRKKYGVSSWVLACAAYNVGVPIISNSISKQGTSNYFNMHLNQETAEYVYKIIAVKELWEYPEVYMKNFGYNVFSVKGKEPKKITDEDEHADVIDFSSATVNINENDSKHSGIDTVSLEKIREIPAQGITEIQREEKEESKKSKPIWAHISKNYKNFNDGELVDIVLDESLQLDNTFIRKGNIIRRTGYIIDNRIFIDLGNGEDVILYDRQDSKQGIPVNSLKDKEDLILKVYKTEDN